MNISARLHAAIADLYGGVFREPFADFKQRSMERLRNVIPFDSGVWASGMTSTNTVSSLTLVDHDPSLLLSYALNWQTHDLVRAAAVANPGVAYRYEDLMSLAEYRQTAIYREFTSLAGIEHTLGTVQNDPAADVGELIFLFRKDRAAPFTDEERDLAQLIAPHMVGAWRQRQIAHDYEAAMAGASPWPVVGVQAVIDDSGFIHASDDEFGLAIRTTFPDWRGPNIPTSAMGVLTSADGAVSAGGLDFSLVRGEQRHILAVARSDREERLTRAETRVAALFADGQTHSQIARRLGVSQSTVRNQIAAIYRKLDIHSKAELARLMPAARRLSAQGRDADDYRIGSGPRGSYGDRPRHPRHTI